MYLPRYTKALNSRLLGSDEQHAALHVSPDIATPSEALCRGVTVAGAKSPVGICLKL